MDPEYLAERLRSHHDLSTPAALDQLLEICRERGCPVRWGRFAGQGYYLRLPEPLILLDHQAGASVLAHELYHHLIADLDEWAGGEDETLALYIYTPRGRSQQERDANHFAQLLCGE
jgi:hypothetical protein